MELRKQFVQYLKSYYGAGQDTINVSLPPLEVGPQYPAFQKENEGMMMLAEQLGQPALGAGMPGMGGPSLMGGMGPMSGGPGPMGGPMGGRRF